MNKKWILVALIVLSMLAGAFFLFRNRLNPAQAKLEIARTNVPAHVFINGEQVAQATPYEKYLKSGEVTVRLVPVSSDKPLALWETRVVLTEGVTTVIRHEFGETNNQSQGEILSFEKIGGKKAEIAVVSVPDSAQVQFNGEVRGFTPLPINNATANSHTLLVSHPGYISREIEGLQPVSGYRLTVIVLLAEDPAEKAKKEAQEEAFEEGVEQTEVEILETGVGFLRVRQDPSKASSEVAKVTPGKTYPFIEESEDKEWFKIEYEKGKTGWISAEYAKKQNRKD